MASCHSLILNMETQGSSEGELRPEKQEHSGLALKGFSLRNLSVQLSLFHPLPFSTACGNKHSRESQWKGNFIKSKPNSQQKQQQIAQMLACFRLTVFN